MVAWQRASNQICLECSPGEEKAGWCAWLASAPNQRRRRSQYRAWTAVRHRAPSYDEGNSLTILRLDRWESSALDCRSRRSCRSSEKLYGQFEMRGPSLVAGEAVVQEQSLALQKREACPWFIRKLALRRLLASAQSVLAAVVALLFAT